MYQHINACFLLTFRFMVGCGRCDDWFHGDCVGLSLFQAQRMGEEDKEYVCVKCCAEEDKKPDVVDPNIPDTQAKLETTREGRTMESEKPGASKQTSAFAQNKTKQGEDALKHRVKIFKRVNILLLSFYVTNDF